MEKGVYGYGKKKLKGAILKTVICFAVVFGAVLAGVLIFGNRKNIFTVLGIVMVLPSANFCVNLIIRLRGTPVTEAFYQKFAERTGGLVTAADMIVTANQKNYPVQLAVFAENGIVAFTKPGKDHNNKVVQMDLNSMCSQAGLTHRVQLFDNEEQFLKRVSSIRPAESEEMKERLLEERKQFLLFSM